MNPDAANTIPDDSGLEAFFRPRGVAIIGASRDENKLGFGIVKNLQACGYPGRIYPVNPKAATSWACRATHRSLPYRTPWTWPWSSSPSPPRPASSRTAAGGG